MWQPCQGRSTVERDQPGEQLRAQRWTRDRCRRVRGAGHRDARPHNAGGQHFHAYSHDGSGGRQRGRPGARRPNVRDFPVDSSSIHDMLPSHLPVMPSMGSPRTPSSSAITLKMASGSYSSRMLSHVAAVPRQVDRRTRSTPSRATNNLDVVRDVIFMTRHRRVYIVSHTRRSCARPHGHQFPNYNTNQNRTC